MDTVPTPGSRRSRNSMQRQTFSVSSSSNSSWRDRGKQEWVDDPYGVSPPTPPLRLAVSPVARRWRQPLDGHRLESICSPVSASPRYAAADGAAATASPLAFGVDPIGSSPKSPTSIHEYGYRSPRFGASDDGGGDGDGGDGGGGGGGGRQACAPARPLSGAVSRGGATETAVVARDTSGWTRPVLEGGSVRLAAGETHQSTLYLRSVLFNKFEPRCYLKRLFCTQAVPAITDTWEGETP